MLLTILTVVALVAAGAYLQYRFNIAKYVGLKTPNVN